MEGHFIYSIIATVYSKRCYMKKYYNDCNLESIDGKISWLLVHCQEFHLPKCGIKCAVTNILYVLH